MFTFSGMRHSSLAVVCFLLILIGAGCSSWFDSGNFDKISENILEDVIEKDVVLHLNNQTSLPDYSPKAVELWFSSAKKYQGKLDELETSKLEPGRIVDFEKLHSYLELVSQRDSFLYHSYLLTHLHGLHLEAPRFFERLTIESKSDVENYLFELAEVETKFGGLIDGLDNQRKLGIVPPTFVLKRIITQCDSLAEIPVEESPFLTALVRKLTDSKMDQTEALESCKQTVLEIVIPSYKRLAAYLRQLERASVSVAGVWQLPKGDEFYRYILQFHTGYSDQPNQLYQIGKVELASIEGELAILKTMSKNVDSSFAILNEDYLYDEASIFPAFERGVRLFEKYVRLSGLESVSPEDKFEFMVAHQLATAEMMTDIGIHHKQWLREQAIRFLADHSILNSVQAQRNVDRIIVYPGLESSSNVGFLKLKEIQGEKPAAAFLKEISALQPMQLNVLEKWLNRGEKLPS